MINNQLQINNNNVSVCVCVVTVVFKVCRLQAELTRLRCSVERGEAQRVELQYQLTLSRRDAERITELSRDKQVLTGTRIQRTFLLHAACDPPQEQASRNRPIRIKLAV